MYGYEGRISVKDRDGNDRADHWADEAADEVQISDMQLQIINDIDRNAWLIQNRLVAIAMHFHIASPNRNDDETITKPKVSRLNLKIEGLDHQIRTSSNRWNICLICGQSWHDNGRLKLIGRGKCPGDKLWSQNQEQQPWKLLPIGFLFHDTVVHQTHRLSWHRGVIYCDLCGSTAIKRVRKDLRNECVLRPVDHRINKLKHIHDGKPPPPHKVWPQQQCKITRCLDGNILYILGDSASIDV